jgi:hypothetical protein
MAVTITSNKKNRSACLHINANATIVVAGNSSVSNVATSDETLSGVTITQVFWGIDPSNDGHAMITRDGSIVGVYDSTGYKDYAGNGMALNVNSTANIEVTFHGSRHGGGTAEGYLFIEVQKIGTFIDEYFRGA